MKKFAGEPSFKIIRGLAPAYERMGSVVVPDLQRLKELAGKNRIRQRERTEIARLLNRVGKTVFKEVEKTVGEYNLALVRGYNPLRIKQFEREFGHPPADISRKGKMESNCVANAIAQNILFSESGFPTGVFFASGHVVPSVKIGGTTYVLERKLFSNEKALTLREYLTALSKAFKKPPRELRGLQKLAKEIVSVKNPEPRHFAAALKYFGGADAAIAAAYFNIGKTFDELGDPRTAIKYYRQAVRRNPIDADARNNLDIVLQKIGRRRQAIERLSFKPQKNVEARGVRT